MVPVAAAVITDGTADIVRHRGDIADECFERFAFERRSGHGLVEVVHISLVMAVVVDFHGQRVKVGFERVLGIGQGR